MHSTQTTTFKGARYVTKFADPIEWDSTRAYEAIEAVQNNGFTYLSKQPVPAGVQIDNDDFWLLWADPNAQMEQLRALVETYTGTVEDLSEVTAHSFDSVSGMQNYDGFVPGDIAHTNGFYNANDGGSAWYVISSDGSANGIDVIGIPSDNNPTLFAHLVIDGYINAAQLGCCGDNDVQQNVLDRVFELSEELKNTLTSSESSKVSVVFPIGFETQGEIKIPSKTAVEIGGTLHYTGLASAIVLDNTRESSLEFNDILTTTGNGIKLYQHGTGDSDSVGWNYIKGNSIKATNGIGLLLEANDQGIVECDFDINFIIGQNGGIIGNCNQANTEIQSYIGQCNFNVSWIKSNNGYAVHFKTEENTLKGVVTGISFGETSFENSAGGIKLDGFCRNVTVQKLRTQERASFENTSLIHLKGNVTDCIITTAPGIYDYNLINETTAIPGSCNKIIGTLFTPNGFPLPGVLLVYENKTVFKCDYERYLNSSGQVPARVKQFGKPGTNDEPLDNYNWRTYDYIYQQATDPIEYTLNTGKLRYFDPMGINEIIISQNSNSNAVVDLILDNVLIFDGSAQPTGRHTFSVKIMYDSMTNDNKIVITQLD